ncbi:MAG: FecR domain-containing protein [Lautropia sp.]|nr:FecR domain-containing protein [Lautropia sp.]
MQPFPGSSSSINPLQATDRRHAAWSAPGGAQLLAQTDHASRRLMMRRCMIFGAAMAAAGLVDGGVAWRRLIADHRTDIGVQRDVELNAQTSLMLNTRTAVDVTDDGRALRVRLLQGEVLLRQHLARRPVIIETPQGEVRSQQGRLVVRRFEKDTSVDVLAGSADVHPVRAESPALQVAAGRHISFDRREIGSSTAVDPAQTAWIDGLIVARQMELARFVDELQRYSSTRLSCDPNVARLPVSGSFPIADLKRVFVWLAQTMPLQVEVQNRQWGRQALMIRAIG